MKTKLPSGLYKLILQRTGKTRHIINKTLTGDRVDPELVKQIDEIVKGYTTSRDEMLERINEL